MRRRARKPRGRTGCRTCRIRRIKCDELRPICVRCSSTGRTCDGYETFLFSSVLAHRSISLRVDAVPNSSLNLSSYEAQTFDFFRQRTVKEITGCFRSQLFERFLLQVSHQDPTILHAAAAVGAMHLNQKSRRISTSLMYPNEPHQNFAL